MSHAFIIWEIVTESQVEDEIILAIEHKRCVKFQFPTPVILIKVFEIGNLWFSICVENLTTYVCVPPIKQRVIVRNI